MLFILKYIHVVSILEDIRDPGTESTLDHIPVLNEEFKIAPLTGDINRVEINFLMVSNGGQ